MQVGVNNEAVNSDFALSSFSIDVSTRMDLDCCRQAKRGIKMQVKQLRFGGKAKQQTCLDCPSFERFAENIGLCRKYNFEVWLSLAGKAKVCRDFELHHAMPTGKLTPTKRILKAPHKK